jgi:hypothetical protein
MELNRKLSAFSYRENRCLYLPVVGGRRLMDEKSLDAQWRIIRVRQDTGSHAGIQRSREFLP